MKNFINFIINQIIRFYNVWSISFISSRLVNFQNAIKTTIKILGYWKYQIGSIFLIFLFWFLSSYILSQGTFLEVSDNIVEAQGVITPEQIFEYLKLSGNNYKVLDSRNQYIYNEMYQGYCDLENLVEQRFDAYCLEPSVLHDHVTGRQPALACCQKYGIDWHRSLVIYIKNTSFNKPVYPGWDEALQNPLINPDMLPVPSGPRYGFSDWDRGGPLYQWMLYNDAVELVTFYDSGEYEKVIRIIESDKLVLQDQVYHDFMVRVKNDEFVSSVIDAKKFLHELKLRDIEIQKPEFKILQKDCPTCK